MIYPIANAPCSWGVDDPKNPNLPAWATVLKEAAQAGYRSIELGPWGYLPTDPASLRAALEQHQLSLVAGTIFDDLVSEAHFPHPGSADPSNLPQSVAGSRCRTDPGPPFPATLSGDYRLRQPRTGALCRARRAGSAPQ